jgi:hypothetical protein
MFQDGNQEHFFNALQHLKHGATISIKIVVFTLSMKKEAKFHDNTRQ